MTDFEDAAQAILDARDAFPNETLATLYSPSAMPLALRRAHDRMDLLVDKVFGLKKPTTAVRTAALLKKHHELVAPQPTLLDVLKSPRRPKASGKLGYVPVSGVVSRL
jgi:hypothetical protein